MKRQVITLPLWFAVLKSTVRFTLPERVFNVINGFAIFIKILFMYRCFHTTSGSKSYIEDNLFSISHHVVNVYRKPEKRYEVRSEDNAVDVQIHG